MGSIIKKPKAPAVRQIAPRIIAPAPVADVVAEPKKTDAEISADSRRQGLLRRSRGRLGTIATSFRGLLNSADSNNSNQRKTLLGE